MLRPCTASAMMFVLPLIMSRYPHIRPLVMLADRGLLSVENLADLSAISLPDGQPLEFIFAVPGCRYGEFAELLQPHCTPPLRQRARRWPKPLGMDCVWWWHTTRNGRRNKQTNSGWYHTAKKSLAHKGPGWGSRTDQ